MFARFLRFYPGYTCETALKMPWRRFTALLAEIPKLEAEEDLRALMVAGIGANPGEKGKQFSQMARELQRKAGLKASEAHKISTIVPGVPGVKVAEPGSIEAERVRQKAAAEQLEQRRLEYERQRGKG
jgi:hypothetical protein